MNAIIKRQNRNKKLLLKQLKERPIVQIACKRSGIGRATYYRWRREDPEFLKESDEAIQEGSLFVNDMAESQLMNAIRDKNMTAIIFWLKHHHDAYANRVEIKGKLKHQYKLSSEQEELVLRALSMVVGKTENE